jgi:hypothetical protein
MTSIIMLALSAVPVALFTAAIVFRGNLVDESGLGLFHLKELVLKPNTIRIILTTILFMNVGDGFLILLAQDDTYKPICLMVAIVSHRRRHHVLARIHALERQKEDDSCSRCVATSHRRCAFLFHATQISYVKFSIIFQFSSRNCFGYLLCSWRSGSIGDV